jgi:hypothetical protein
MIYRKADESRTPQSWQKALRSLRRDACKSLSQRFDILLLTDSPQDGQKQTGALALP